MVLRRQLSAVFCAAAIIATIGQPAWASPATTGGPATAPVATSPAAPAWPDRPTGAGYSVTLLTGDRVTVQSAAATTGSVQRGKGRDAVSFDMFTMDGHLYVLPADARRLVQAGTVDRRLFDVTGLITAGYHDAARKTVPLIVQYRRGLAKAAKATVAGAGATVTRDLSVIGGVSVNADKAKAGTVWQALTGGRGAAKADPADGVAKIWLDGIRRPLLDVSVPQIGAPAAWRAGFTGRGVTVAVLDTGVDTTHPDLAGKVAASAYFADQIPGDQVGHGTHVASTIAGSGAASGGRYKGVAPDATLVSGKVCSDIDCSDSSIIAGMQWAARERHARVINMSLGGPDFPGVDPMEEAVDTLTAETGALFVVAAGNDGRRGIRTISSPASADAALAVGAVDKSDAIADFSSRGPRSYDSGLKPEITAPGVNIVAARGVGTDLGPRVGDAYTTASGTSMATPHVVGAAALLAQQHPDFTSTQLKATLMASARPNPALSAYEQGAGRVDVTRAITQNLTTSPPAVSFGLAMWPHADDAAVHKTVTYQNPTAAEVKLTLAVQATGPAGKPAPAGMFTLEAQQLTVPAGGTAEVNIAADTRVAGPDGAFTGRVVATAGQQTVITPFAVEKEVESYNLTLKHVGADGKPAVNYLTVLRGLDGGRGYVMSDDTGTISLRQPKARYAMCNFIDTSTAGDGSSEAMTVAPLIDLKADTTIVADARKTRPLSMTVPEPTAKVFSVAVDAQHIAEGFTDTCASARPDFGLTTGQLGSPLSAREFRADVTSVWAKPAADGRPALDSPYAYRVAEPFDGRFPTGLVKRYTGNELAAVRQDYRSTGPGQVGVQQVGPVLGAGSDGQATELPFAVPSSRVEYYSTRQQWNVNATLIGKRVSDTEFEPTLWLSQGPTSYRPRQRYTQTWGATPFGPATPPILPPRGDGQRAGEFLAVSVPLVGDAAGHRGYGSSGERMRVFRNGELIGSNDDAANWFGEVPAEESRYRLEASSTNTTFGGLSTQVSVIMTFVSGHTPDTFWTPLSLPSVVRYTPKLDVHGAAAAGGRFAIPVSVQNQQGDKGAPVAKLTVDVSYNDGATWQRAALTRCGKSGWTATVSHPAGAGYVSLRASSVDSAGNTLSQTIMHAYQLVKR